MKSFALIAAILFSSISLIAQPPKGKASKGTVYGEAVQAKAAVPVDDLTATLTEPGVKKDAVVTGKVVDVCTMQGCWMRLETKDGSMLVKMKDHAFFVPLALKGKTVAVDGSAVYSETSVETLKHYAEDAGKSEEEIAKITEPKQEIVMTANGVRVIK